MSKTCGQIFACVVSGSLTEKIHKVNCIPCDGIELGSSLRSHMDTYLVVQVCICAEVIAEICSVEKPA